MTTVPTTGPRITVLPGGDSTEKIATVQTRGSGTIQVLVAYPSPADVDTGYKPDVHAWLDKTELNLSADECLQVQEALSTARSRVIDSTRTDRLQVAASAPANAPYTETTYGRVHPSPTGGSTEAPTVVTAFNDGTYRLVSVEMGSEFSTYDIAAATVLRDALTAAIRQAEAWSAEQ